MIEQKVAVIDLDSICFAAFNGNKILDENGIALRTEDNKKFLYTEKTEEQVVESCDWLMNTLLVNSGATGYISFIKGSKTISDRLAINSEYKANRPKEKPKYWDLCKNHFVTKWNAIEANGAEVDDYCRITNLQIPNSFICAIDGDLLKLEGTSFNWSKNEWITTTKEEADYKFWSDMICGQTGDNISGLKNKGKKFVENLFEKLNYKTELEYAEVVFSAYLVHYSNVNIAIKEYYKTYMCLKILTEKQDFILPEINKFKI